MKDFNFFSIYSKRKASSTQNVLKAGLVVAAVVLLIGGSYFTLAYYRSILDKETTRIDAYLQSAEVNEKLAAIEEYNAKEIVIEEYSRMITDVLNNLKAADTINSGRLDAISAALPRSVTMKSLQMQDTTASIVFYVPDVATAAQVVSALDALDLFESVSLTDIDGSDASGLIYTATISAELKGGA